LTIPQEDLVRLVFSSATNEDVAATMEFDAIGQIEEESFSGHTPGTGFDFQPAELKEIDFGLPPTLAAISPKAPLQILWFMYSGWTPESIYQSGGMGYSHVAQIAENLGAGNAEVSEAVNEHAARFDPSGCPSHHAGADFRAGRRQPARRDAAGSGAGADRDQYRRVGGVHLRHWKDDCRQ
jgi:hypothetical protein